MTEAEALTLARRMWGADRVVKVWRARFSTEGTPEYFFVDERTGSAGKTGSTGITHRLLENGTTMCHEECKGKEIKNV